MVGEKRLSRTAAAVGLNVLFLNVIRIGLPVVNVTGMFFPFGSGIHASG